MAILFFPLQLYFSVNRGHFIAYKKTFLVIIVINADNNPSSIGLS